MALRTSLVRVAETRGRRQPRAGVWPSMAEECGGMYDGQPPGVAPSLNAVKRFLVLQSKTIEPRPKSPDVGS